MSINRQHKHTHARSHYKTLWPTLIAVKCNFIKAICSIVLLCRSIAFTFPRFRLKMKTFFFFSIEIGYKEATKFCCCSGAKAGKSYRSDRYKIAVEPNRSACVCRVLRCDFVADNKTISSLKQNAAAQQ